MNCPECKKEAKLLPERKVSTETITNGTALTFPVTTFTGPSYPPTSKTFKCCNDECWVTKIEETWS